MCRFVYIGDGRYINADEIVKILERNKEIVLVFRNENTTTADCCYLESVLGSDHVVQIMKADNVHVIYDQSDDGEKDWECKCDCFAVCADGYIRGVVLSEDGIDFVDAASNFKKYKKIDGYGWGRYVEEE